MHTLNTESGLIRKVDALGLRNWQCMLEAEPTMPCVTKLKKTCEPKGGMISKNHLLGSRKNVAFNKSFFPNFGPSEIAVSLVREGLMGHARVLLMHIFVETTVS